MAVSALAYGPPLAAAGAGGVAIQGSGTSVVSNSTVQFANSNGLTFGINGSTVTASHNGLTAETQTFLGGVIVGAVTQTAGNVVISNGSGVSWGLNASTLTASIAAGATATGNMGALAAAGSTATSGTVSFSNSNGVSFGMNGQTITASVAAGAAAPNMSVWFNNTLQLNGLNVSRVTRAIFWPVNLLAPMAGAMTWDTAGLMMSGATNVTTVDTHTVSVSLGLYRISNATKISLINSVSYTTGMSTSGSSYAALYAGTRYLTLNSSAWSAAPAVSAGGSYWLGAIFSTSGAWPAGVALLGNNQGFFGSSFSGAVGLSGTSQLIYPFLGEYTAVTAALPVGVGTNDLALTNNTGMVGVMPTAVAAQGVSWL